MRAMTVRKEMEAGYLVTFPVVDVVADRARSFVKISLFVNVEAWPFEETGL